MNPKVDIPNPDPTIMTTEQLERAVQCLREIIETRLNGMDQRFAQLHADFDRIPIDISKAINHLAELHDEKFHSVQKQFDERDVRTDTSRVSDKTAVDAALAAQEKSFSKQGETFSDATAKSEQQFTKQMDQMTALHQTEIRGLQAQFNDLKDRFNRGEGRGEGVEKGDVTHRAANSYMIAIIGVIIAVLGLGAGIVIAIVRR